MNLDALVWALGSFSLGLTVPVVTYFLRSVLIRRRSALAERRRLERLRDRGSKDAKPVRLTPRLPDRTAKVPFFYLTDLRVANLRCFPEATLALRFPGEGVDLQFPNVNLLLGDNGSGKSTLLRAAAMTALAPVLEGSGFVPYRLVRENTDAALAEGAFVVAGARGAEALSSAVTVRRRGDFELIATETGGDYWADLFEESRPSFFVAGYGVNRRVADDSRSDPSLERGRRRRRFQRVSSLFDESVALVPFGAWLPTIDGRRRAEVVGIIDSLLPQGARFSGRFEGEEPVFVRHDVAVTFRALSDGFRSYLGWLGDLLFHLTAVAPAQVRLGDMGGIVLVDEIDLLLHPFWQRRVVPTISRMFPNIQFIMTSHSPIVTGTLEAANITVARESDSAGVSALFQVRAEVHGLNAEQVLLSSYFGLETTRSPDAALTIADLGRLALTGDIGARDRYLEAILQGTAPGDTGR